MQSENKIALNKILINGLVTMDSALGFGELKSEDQVYFKELTFSLREELSRNILLLEQEAPKLTPNSKAEIKLRELEKERAFYALFEKWLRDNARPSRVGVNDYIDSLRHTANDAMDDVHARIMALNTPENIDTSPRSNVNPNNSFIE